MSSSDADFTPTSPAGKPNTESTSDSSKEINKDSGQTPISGNQPEGNIQSSIQVPNVTSKSNTGNKPSSSQSSIWTSQSPYK